MSRVKATRYRTRSGAKVKRKAHKRLDPRRAGRRAVSGYQAARNRRYAAGAGLIAGGAAEFAGWGLARGLAVGLLAAGLVLVGAGVQMRRSAK